MSELVNVSFCGRDDSFVDNLYGTGLEFFNGKPRALPHDLAAKFLHHVGQFERVELTEKTSKKAKGDDTEAVLAESAEKKKEADAKLDEVFEAQNQIAHMNKAGLLEYAQIKYRQEIDSKLKVGEIRTQVAGMIDQFGVL